MKNDIENIWTLFERLDEPFLLVRKNTLVRCNDAAHQIFNKDLCGKSGKFSLSKYSPELQPNGELSSQKEIEHYEYAKKYGCHRFSWLLKNLENENHSVEITLFFPEILDLEIHYMIFRNIDSETETRQLIIEKLEEIERKDEHITELKNKITFQTEIIETQRDVALIQKEEIFQSKKEITDSIKYAGRFQSTLLASKNEFSKIFSDHFILYKPKDIVSGDFYWLSKRDNQVILAAADCTGHGVPGAFMSMIGIVFLNEIVNELGLLQPNLILENLRDRIVNTFNQEGESENTMDGMDIALVTFYLDNSTMQYSGAFNSVFVIRENELIELKADRMPLGFITNNPSPFTNHEIRIIKNDSIYLFSDGFMSQFGWRNNKKFQMKNFRQLLLDIQNVPLEAQKVLLENSFNNWKGKLDQIDDIMVIGVKI